jgi:hypothetical protein
MCLCRTRYLARLCSCHAGHGLVPLRIHKLWGKLEQLRDAAKGWLSFDSHNFWWCNKPFIRVSYLIPRSPVEFSSPTVSAFGSSLVTLKRSIDYRITRLFRCMKIWQTLYKLLGGNRSTCKIAWKHYTTWLFCSENISGPAGVVLVRSIYMYSNLLPRGMRYLIVVCVTYFMLLQWL